MNRFCLRHRHYLCGSFVFFTKKFAYDTLEDPPEFEPKTGVERVIKAFSDPAPGMPSKELISVLQFIGGSLIIGFMVGGMMRGSRAYTNFIIANQHTKFVTPYEAKRKLQDTVTLHFMKGGLFWGLKAAIFTGTYSFCVIAIPIFRNTKEGVLEYTIGGALAGGLARAYLGVRATVAGAILVGACTSLIGISTVLLSTPMSEISDMQYSWYEWRRKRKEDIIAAARRNPSGHALPDILSLRERAAKQKDSLGYANGETVYVALTEPSEISESTVPEAGDEKKNEQLNTPISAVVHETTGTSK